MVSPRHWSTTIKRTFFFRLMLTPAVSPCHALLHRVSSVKHTRAPACSPRVLYAGSAGPALCRGYQMTVWTEELHVAQGGDRVEQTASRRAAASQEARIRVRVSRAVGLLPTVPHLCLSQR